MSDPLREALAELVRLIDRWHVQPKLLNGQWNETVAAARAALSAVQPSPPRELAVIAAQLDAHDMHEFYCGMLQSLLHAAESYMTVFPGTIRNRVSQDAVEALREQIAAVSEYLRAGQQELIEVATSTAKRLSCKTVRSSDGKDRGTRAVTPDRCNVMKCGEYNPLRCCRKVGHDGEHNYCVDGPAWAAQRAKPHRKDAPNAAAKPASVDETPTDTETP